MRDNTPYRYERFRPLPTIVFLAAAATLGAIFLSSPEEKIETTEVASAPEPPRRVVTDGLGDFDQDVTIEVDKAVQYSIALEEAERQRAAEAEARQRAQEEARRRAAAERQAREQRAARSAPAERGDIWWQLALCESGGNPRAVNPSGKYRGAFQFSLATWRSIGMSGDPINHSYEEQLAAAKRLQARSGWGQWPQCARKLGLL